MKQLFYISILLFCFSIFSHGVFVGQSFTLKEQKSIDSLKLIINDQLDTTSIICCTELSSIYYKYNIDSAIYFSTKAKNKSEKINFERGKKESYNWLGFLFLKKEMISEASIYFHRSLNLIIKEGKKEEIANSLGNLAYIFQLQENNIKALDYYLQSLELRKDIKNKKGIASTLSNIGVLHNRQEKHDLAFKFFNQSLAIQKQLNDLKGIAISLTHIASILIIKQSYNDALVKLEQSIKISKNINDKEITSVSLNKLGDLYLKLGKINQASTALNESFSLAKELKYPELIKHVTFSLSQTFEVQNKNKEALEMFELHIKMKDSLNNTALKENIIKQTAEYEYKNKQELDKVIHQKKIAVEQEKKKKQKIFTIIISTATIIVLFFLMVLIKRILITRKQTKIIQKQSNEIAKGINYAKKIQTAILPTRSALKNHLPDHFILYKPKDVVAGDFYWMSHKKNKTIFAVADCTGHGVPGALVSVICNNALNRSVREHQLTTTNNILDKTREIVIEEFEKSDIDVKDGMDIALCAIENNILSYSGANNPLWIIREGNLTELT